jgi:FH1/FH2 domain-containing protein 3
LDYLAKVPEVKDTIQKHSLLFHVCNIVVEKYSETSDLYSDIGQITRCSKVNISRIQPNLFLFDICPSICLVCKIDFDELELKLNKLENDCRAAFDHLRAISKHETPQIKTKYVYICIFICQVLFLLEMKK